MKMKNAVKRLDVIFGWLKTIRERWMILAFVVSAIFWLEDVGRVYMGLPDLLDEKTRAIEAIETRLDVLENRVDRAFCAWPQCLGRLGKGLI
ncbi:MAG: hypothetical protein AAGC81_01325 [Pseudomonadota bacterium]